MLMNFADESKLRQKDACLRCRNIKVSCRGMDGARSKYPCARCVRNGLQSQYKKYVGPPRKKRPRRPSPVRLYPKTTRPSVVRNCSSCRELHLKFTKEEPTCLECRDNRRVCVYPKSQHEPNSAQLPTGVREIATSNWVGTQALPNGPTSGTLGHSFTRSTSVSNTHIRTLLDDGSLNSPRWLRHRTHQPSSFRTYADSMRQEPQNVGYSPTMNSQTQGPAPQTGFGANAPTGYQTSEGSSPDAQGLFASNSYSANSTNATTPTALTAEEEIEEEIQKLLRGRNGE